jgi:hypothetical protein
LQACVVARPRLSQPARYHNSPWCANMSTARLMCMDATAYDQRKLQELVMLVAERSQEDRNFGMTKLNKILFFADFTAYQRTGRSITGAKYQHLDQGPCPQQLVPALRGLGSSLREVREDTYAGTMRRLVPTRPADASLFSGAEVALVDEVMRILMPLNNREASQLSHETMAWRLTEDRQEVPYATAVISPEAPNASDRAWLEGVARARVAPSQG